MKAFSPRAEHRDQSGYVLGVVLAAMTVGLILITALLSLSFATHRAAIVQQELAREQRAADGALETGLTRTRVGFNTSPVADPCGFVGPSREVESIDYDWNTAAGADDVTMELFCDEVIGNGIAADRTVRIVGDEYTHGSLPDAYDWEAWPWADALGTDLDAPSAPLSPTLVHSGDEPLLFNGSVAVRRGAAGFLTTDDPPEAGAVAVAGGYYQVDRGHLGTDDNPCGMLAVGNPDLPEDADLARTAVVDSDGIPECDGGADASAFGPSEVSAVRTGTIQTVGACATEDVMHFEPGIYDVGATADLNALFAGDGTCDNKVFHFKPGDYWFNTGGSAKPLVFNDDTSAFVFGTLEGTGQSATCKPDVEGGGVKIVFSGRSTFRHLAGNVSICGNPNAPHTLVQTEVGSPGITFDPLTIESELHCNAGGCGDPAFDSVGDVLSFDGAGGAVAAVDCVPFNKSCDLGFTVDMKASGDRPINDLRLTWTSSELPQAHTSNNRTVRAVITDSGGATICDKTIAAGRTPGFISGINLSSCAPGLTEGDLDGASLLVRFSYKANTYLPDPPWPLQRIELNVRNLTMLVNAGDVDATSASGAWSQWRDNSNEVGNLPGVLTPGGSWARPIVGKCGSSSGFLWLPSEFCKYEPGEVVPQVITLSDMQFTSDGFSADDEIDRVFLAVDNRLPDSLVAGPNGPGNRGSTSVTITLEDGFSCTPQMKEYNTYTRSANTYYIDLAVSPCEQLSGRPASSLDGADITFSITPERGTDVNGTLYPQLGLALPWIDHIYMTATTQTETGFSRALVTIDTADAAHVSDFRVHGNVLMPRTSLNVHWTGAGKTGVEPIVNGNLELDSLGSSGDAGARVGIVCCGDGQREGRLVAAIAGPEPVADRVRGVARASYAKTDGPLADALVTGWQLCGGGSCGLPTDSSLFSNP